MERCLCYQFDDKSWIWSRILQSYRNELHETKHRCQRCGEPKVKKQCSPSMWHHWDATDRQFMCLECEAQTPRLTCHICNISKPEDQFAASALHHKSHRNIRCLDCTRPPCMFLAQKCATCPQCRDPVCRKKGRCTAGIQVATVNSQQLPASLEDIRNFACDRCRFITCIVRRHDGTLCGAQRKGKKQQAQARQDKQDYSCDDCQTWLLSQKRLQTAAASSSTQ